MSVPGSLINEKRGSISVTKDGITVTAEAEAHYRTPYNLENYFTPFRVVVRNETGHPFNIAYDDFLLLDEKGNLYKSYSPEKMAEIVKSDPEYILRPPTIAVMGNNSSINYPFSYGSTYPVPYYDEKRGHWSYPYYNDGFMRDRRFYNGETLMQDIFLTALPVGSIISGAQVFGNVYFRTDMSDIKSARVRITVDGVEFELPFLVK